MRKQWYRIVRLSLIVISVLFTLISNGQPQLIVDSLENILLNTGSKTERVDIYNELSKTYRQIDYEKSFVYANKALDLANTIEYNQGMLSANYYLGLSYILLGDNLQAMKQFNFSVDQAISTDNYQMQIRIYNSISVMYSRMGNFKKSAEYSFKSLQIAERIDYSPAIIANYINIGHNYLNQDDYKRSKEYLSLALNLAKEANDLSKVAIIYINLGGICMRQQKLDSALIYFEKSWQINKDSHNKTKSITIFNNIGDVYSAKGMYEKAKVYYKKSLTNALFLNDSLFICEATNRIAKNYLNRNQTDSALYYAELSNSIANQIHNTRNISFSEYSLYEIHYQEGMYKEACDNFKTYKLMNDSLFSNENLSAINNTELEYKINIYERELQLSILKKERLFLVSALIISLLFFTLLGAYYYFKQKRAKNKKDREIIQLKLVAAKAELKASTIKMIEMNKTIEKYSLDLEKSKNNIDSNEYKIKVQEFDKLKILNEDDWLKFKNQFKLLHEDFVIYIENKNKDLTEGDKRHLMLIRLGFSINQSADILGVGYRAVQKARQRLGQKLHLDSAKNLNSWVVEIDSAIH